MIPPFNTIGGSLIMTAEIVVFPIERCRQVLTIDQQIEASFAACREIFAVAAAGFAEEPNRLSIRAMMDLALDGACPSTMIVARSWLMRECNVRVTDAAPGVR